MIVTKSREIFPGWMETRPFMPLPLWYFTNMPPPFIFQKASIISFPFTPTFSKLQWYVSVYAHGSFKWQICRGQILCFTYFENYMRFLARNYLISMTMLMMSMVTEQASQVNSETDFKPGYLFHSHKRMSWDGIRNHRGNESEAEGMM